MPGTERTTPVPIQQNIVEENGMPTEAFVRYLEEISFIEPEPPVAKVPIGTILMYTGAVVDVPEGWLLCDGDNGTPNLIDRFIVGTATEAEIGDTGGSAAPAMPLHTHSMDHSHTGTTEWEGNHTHSYKNYPRNYSGYSANGSDWTINNSSAAGKTTGGGGGHDHELLLEDYVGTTGEKESGDALEGNLPPYYKVAYIIHVAIEDDPTSRRRRR